MPKVFGLEVKPWMLWVAGGGAVLLLLMTMRRGGQSVGIPAPQESYGGIGGTTSPAVQPNEPSSEPPETSDAFTEQLQELLLAERTLDLTHKEAMLGLQRDQAGFLAGLYNATEGARASLEVEVFEGQKAAAEKVFANVDKYPIKCPPGMHPANVPGVGVTCRQLGDADGGRGFQPFKAVGNIVSGFLSGVASAAPGIGSGAIQGWAATQGIIPSTGTVAAGKTTQNKVVTPSQETPVASLPMYGVHYGPVTYGGDVRE